MLLRRAGCHVGQIDSVEINIPLIQVGEGSPRVTLITGLHGDEVAGTFIADHLIRKLVSLEIPGSLQVISSANVAANLTRQRVGFTDFLDINRVDQGNSSGHLTERIANRIFELAVGSDLVVDLHEFEMLTPTAAIYIPSGSIDIDGKALGAIATFDPAWVWVMDTSLVSDRVYGRSIIATLARNGTPSFAVETSSLPYLDISEIEKVSSGILACFRAFSEETLRKSDAFYAFNRSVERSDSSGLWEPDTKRLVVSYPSGTVIGKLKKIGEPEAEEVCLASDKWLLQVLPRSAVNTGTGIYGFGVVNEAVTEQLRSVEIHK